MITLNKYVDSLELNNIYEVQQTVQQQKRAVLTNSRYN